MKNYPQLKVFAMDSRLSGVQGLSKSSTYTKLYKVI